MGPITSRSKNKIICQYIIFYMHISMIVQYYYCNLGKELSAPAFLKAWNTLVSIFILFREFEPYVAEKTINYLACWIQSSVPYDKMVCNLPSGMQSQHSQLFASSPKSCMMLTSPDIESTNIPTYCRWLPNCGADRGSFHLSSAVNKKNKTWSVCNDDPFTKMVYTALCKNCFNKLFKAQLLSETI